MTTTKPTKLLKRLVRAKNTDATTHIMLSWIVDHVQKNQECTNHKIISQYAVVSEKHGITDFHRTNWFTLGDFTLY
ncbi:hypothetical protein T05_10675 [Trichinella murrelli]|uniref:Uncharacterized protein n=1 Tax=Trichinella murrelli TaxID=144512 RepID=A0A0V0T5D4_9BILA|nr:hypothetical protein T05_10675 [Trichinella murrelli]